MEEMRDYLDFMFLPAGSLPDFAAALPKLKWNSCQGCRGDKPSYWRFFYGFLNALPAKSPHNLNDTRKIVNADQNSSTG